MKIRKSNGELVEYDPRKIHKSLRRAGAKTDVIEHVIARVGKKIRSGMTTKEVYHLVREVLKEESSHIAHRYNLRTALLKLGPAGFRFEKYVASIFANYDFETEVPPEEFKGACIHHEVDVVATRGNKRVMIEAKFRNDFRDFVRLKDSMATWARFKDLQDGAKLGTCPKFHEAWVVSNGRISSRSQAWGLCKDMRMIGWNYPKKGSLANFVDKTSLYPITALDNLSRNELDRFSDNNIMLCKEVAEKDAKEVVKTTGISQRRAANIIKTCKAVVGH